MAFNTLGEDEDWNYYVLSTREARQEFLRLLSEYTNLADGQDIDWSRPKSWAQMIDTIESIELYGPEDRRDSSLEGLEFDPRSIVECELWPAENLEAAQARFASVRDLLESMPEAAEILASDDRPDQLTFRVRSRSGRPRRPSQPWKRPTSRCPSVSDHHNRTARRRASTRKPEAPRTRRSASWTASSTLPTHSWGLISKALRTSRPDTPTPRQIPTARPSAASRYGVTWTP